ncbi:MAG: CRISPR system precrRNA processing endoribonuclease RAMP protein Cas6 [Armatimonadetes bacterium]|nr:CRISPR system precrRNA processing endoribonuclease RAMP protein Cas6 [Armatimonadota bacterium]
MLTGFRLHCYRFRLQCQQTVTLPPFSGSTLRGAFASTFRRLSCQQPQRRECAGCVLEGVCAFPAVFEPRPPAEATKAGGFASFPRPFVVVPPGNGQLDHRPGSSLAAGLALIGQGNDYLPYFILALAQLAREGIGRGRGSVAVEQVTSYHPLSEESAPVWEGGDSPVRAACLPITWEQIVAHAGRWDADALHLRFVTPTCLLADRSMACEPTFATLIRCLLRRYTRLAQAYCGASPELPYRELLERAEAVQIAASSLVYHGWERYSRRQDRRVPARGIAGTISYAGPLSEFLPLVLLGSLAHVGDNAALGQGRYEVVG